MRKQHCGKQHVNSCCNFTWLIFNEYLREGDIAQRCPHAKKLHLILVETLLSFPLVSLHSLPPQTLYSVCSVLFSSPPTPSSSINQFPCLRHTSATYVISPHACPQPDSKHIISLKRHFQRPLYRGWAQMPGLLHTVNTPKAQTPLTHTVTA